MRQRFYAIRAALAGNGDSFIVRDSDTRSTVDAGTFAWCSAQAARLNQLDAEQKQREADAARDAHLARWANAVDSWRMRASDRTVIRAARQMIQPRYRDSRETRAQRHAMYRLLLQHHKDARKLFSMVS